MSSLEGDNYWKMAMRRRLSRRRLLALGGVGLAGATLAACGGPKESSKDVPKAETTQVVKQVTAPKYSKVPGMNDLLAKYHSDNIPQSPGKPKMGGTLKIDFPAAIPHFDFVTTQNVPLQGVMLRTYSLLLKLKLGVGHGVNNLKREIEGDLAERWEVAPDGSSYTFYLKKGVKFHNKPPVNGRELTAEDVKYCFEVYRDKSFIKSYFVDVDKMETPDKYTFKITMKQPAVHFLMSLVGPFAFIFPRELYEGPGLKENVIGSGPFMLKEYVPNTRMVLERNPTFFKKDANGNQLPYLDMVESQNYPDPATTKAAFRTEQRDVLAVGTPEEMQEILKTNPRSTVHILPMAPSVQAYISLQNNKKPFDDVRVRRALSMAIDRQDIIDTGFGGAAVPSAYVPFDMMGRDWPPPIEDLGPNLQYNPQKAKQLLAEAGYPNGFKLKVTHGLTSGVYLSGLLIAQRNLKDIGVDAELDQVPSMQYNQAWRGGTWEQGLHDSTSTTGFDLDSYTYDAYYTGVPNNVWHYSDPEFDKILEKQRRTVNAAERQKLAIDIFNYLIDRVPRIGLAAPWRIHLWHPWVQNHADHLYAYSNWHGANQQEAIWMETDYMKK